MRNSPTERGMWKAEVTRIQFSPGFGRHEFMGEHRILGRVARLVFEDQAVAWNAERREEAHRGIGIALAFEQHGTDAA